MDELGLSQVPWTITHRENSELKPELVLSVDTSSISSNQSTLQAKEGGGKSCSPTPQTKDTKVTSDEGR